MFKNSNNKEKREAELITLLMIALNFEAFSQYLAHTVFNTGHASLSL